MNIKNNAPEKDSILVNESVNSNPLLPQHSHSTPGKFRRRFIPRLLIFVLTITILQSGAVFNHETDSGVTTISSEATNLSGHTYTVTISPKSVRDFTPIYLYKGDKVMVTGTSSTTVQLGMRKIGGTLTGQSKNGSFSFTVVIPKTGVYKFEISNNNSKSATVKGGFFYIKCSPLRSN